MNSFRLALCLCVLWLAPWTSAAGADQNEPFSFLVVGDTRTDMFLPGDAGQREAIAAEFKSRRPDHDVSLIFDPPTQGGRLAKAVVAKGGKSTTYTYREGWAETITDGEGDAARVRMRRQGQDWVYNRLAAALQLGAADPKRGPLFLVHSGDIVYGAKQGADLWRSPYWQDFQDRFLGRVPLPDAALGLPGRFFPALGNHDTSNDAALSGVLGVAPYLRDLGLTPQHRVYSFDFRGSRFIFLDSGERYSKGAWSSTTPPFAEQMALLQQWLSEARDKKIRRVFVSFHKPCFVTDERALAPDNCPHSVLKPFAADLDISVFTGHTHTTEAYVVDGVRYVVAGAGGALQDLDLVPRPGQPEELYWKDAKRVEEYNYLVVEVASDALRFWVHRYRPSATAAPFERVPLFAPAP